ncbi:MAG TPA: isocitrate/isopropylmalate family dehydrogenase [Candidatus Sulfotelmatobacter sp.]|nr:isocitrate/isopropylmalate family dehydrogenase [Candidatus Sulfotelmatobacter sp.]
MAKRVCVIKGDDAAPEVVVPTVELLERMRLGLEFIWLTTGEEAIRQHGEGFPLAAKRAVDEADCALFGSARDPRITGLAYLRWGKKTYANFRPIRWMPGMRSPLKRPEGIDFVIVRENLEGLYPGREGDLAALEPLKLSDPMTLQVLDTSKKGKFAVRVITEENSRNIAKAGCELAMKRRARGGRGKVTVVAKYNVLVQSDGLFRQVVEETVAQYPSLRFDQLLGDNFCQQMVINPHQFDVVIMPNESGDAFSDGAAGLVGGLGLAPSACIGDTYAYFEPVHGTAPDLAGKNCINPTAMLLSAKWMLDYLGLREAGERLERAVYQVYAEGKHLTRDQGGTASTTEFCEAVQKRL